MCSFVFLASLLWASVPSEAYAQIAGSTLSGKITSATGFNIPNAHLSLKNMTEGAIQEVSANQDGSFAIHNLRPGTYEITVSVHGFADAKTTVTIAAGIDQTVGGVHSQINLLDQRGRDTQPNALSA